MGITTSTDTTFVLPCGREGNALPCLMWRGPRTGVVPRVGDNVRIPAGLALVTQVEHDWESPAVTVRLGWMYLTDQERQRMHAKGWSGWPQ